MEVFDYVPQKYLVPLWPCNLSRMMLIYQRHSIIHCWLLACVSYYHIYSTTVLHSTQIGYHSLLKNWHFIFIWDGWQLLGSGIWILAKRAWSDWRRIVWQEIWSVLGCSLPFLQVRRCSSPRSLAGLCLVCLLIPNCSQHQLCSNWIFLLMTHETCLAQGNSNSKWSCYSSYAIWISKRLMWSLAGYAIDKKQNSYQIAWKTGTCIQSFEER